MASTGEFDFSSSPTWVGNMSATCRRDGGTVIVDWTASVRMKYSGSFYGTGNTMSITARGSAGGSSTVTIKNSNESWSGTGWHSCNGSFSYANASAHSFTVTFNSTTNTNTGKFSGKSVSLSVGSFSADKTIFIGCNAGAYMEFMCKTPYTFPTWSDRDGQNDIVWVEVGSGSWNRGGIDYGYAAGHTHTNASLDDSWNTHVYIGTTGYGGFHYYPRLYIKYNANGGSSTPATQTKYLGTEINLAGAISRNHYSFQGWSTSSTATSASYSAGKKLGCEAWNSINSAMSSNNGWTDYTPSHSGNTVTLYAVWKGNTYTVSYNANGGSSTPTKSSVVYPSSVTLANAINRTNGSTTGYSVTYNANGGSGAPSGQTSGNRTVTYKFDKWAAGSTSGTKYAAKASYKPTANVTMYATWTTTKSANSSWTCSGTIPTRKNYTFLGWSTSRTATTATYQAGKTYTITKALTLYAVWKEVQAEVKLKQNNTWKNGKMYYKKNGGWQKVRKVYVKKNNKWVLAQTNS